MNTWHLCIIVFNIAFGLGCITSGNIGGIVSLTFGIIWIFVVMYFYNENFVKLISSQGDEK